MPDSPEHMPPHQMPHTQRVWKGWNTGHAEVIVLRLLKQGKDFAQHTRQVGHAGK